MNVLLPELCPPTLIFLFLFSLILFFIFIYFYFNLVLSIDVLSTMYFLKIYFIFSLCVCEHIYVYALTCVYPLRGQNKAYDLEVEL